MPIIKSDYNASALYHRHLSTIYMGRFRKVPLPAYRRERISFEQEDFLDLDWLTAGNKKLIVISHGLEGSSSSMGVK